MRSRWRQMQVSIVSLLLPKGPLPFPLGDKVEAGGIPSPIHTYISQSLPSPSTQMMQFWSRRLRGTQSFSRIRSCYFTPPFCLLPPPFSSPCFCLTLPCPTEMGRRNVTTDGSARGRSTVLVGYCGSALYGYELLRSDSKSKWVGFE